MVSVTQHTEKRRAIRLKRAGRKRKHLAQLHGTPAFPVHPPGYDPNAADAKGHKPSSDA